MKVKAICNVLYKAEIYERGQEFEIDDVTGRVWEKHGWVKILESGNFDTDFTPAEGLPPLEVGKKKK